MTFALIVACKDDFYLISDTLTHSVDDSTGLVLHYSLNTKKTFYSNKHKIGMCIAGDGSLKFPGVKNEKDILDTSFVLNEFFEYLDTLAAGSCPVDSIHQKLKYFMHTKYLPYEAYFFQNVSYFFGGFIVSNGNSVTSIFSHHAGKEEIFSCTAAELGSKPCYFTNDKIFHKIIDQTLQQPNAPKINHNEFLTNPDYRKVGLTDTVPRACVAINVDQPYSVGEYLEHIRITPTAPVRCGIKYHYDNASTALSAEIVDIASIPRHLTYRSYKESNAAFLSGQLVKYSAQDGRPLQISKQVATP